MLLPPDFLHETKTLTKPLFRTVLRIFRQPHGPRRLLLRAVLRHHFRQHHRRHSHSQWKHLQLVHPCHRSWIRHGHPGIRNRADWIGSVDNLGESVRVASIFHAVSTRCSVRSSAGEEEKLLSIFLVINTSNNDSEIEITVRATSAL